MHAVKTYLTRDEQWTRTVHLFLGHAVRYWRRRRSDVRLNDISDHIGVVAQASAFTRVGDIFFPTSPNGDDRWAFTGVSSKGRCLVRYYQTIRPRKKGGRVQLFKLPDEVASLSPLDPAVRDFVMKLLDSLRAGDVAALQ